MHCFRYSPRLSKPGQTAERWRCKLLEPVQVIGPKEHFGIRWCFLIALKGIFFFLPVNADLLPGIPSNNPHNCDLPVYCN
jgi:hypothetical protein